MTCLLRVLVVSLVITGAAFANDEVALPVPGQPLAAPPVLARRHGQLHVDLSAAPGEYAIGGERFQDMLYNDSYIPPVWRLKPGDTLAVALYNRLQQPTNLHFHGLQVSPRANGDNVFVHVGPGESFQYRIEIPHDHDSGLFWFHPHAHGFVSQQIIAGLSGAIILEGITRRYPMLRNMKERVMLLKHIPHPQADWEELVTLNGQIAPTIAIQPGETQFWRIGNVGADLFLRLKLDDTPMHVVATDGHTLVQPQRADDIPKHEDKGIMQIVDVEEARSPGVSSEGRP